MAIALLGHGITSRFEDSSSDLTLSYTSHSGNNKKMIVVVTTTATTATSKIGGIKYNNVSFTAIDWFQMDTLTTYYNMHIFYLDNASFPAAGAHNLVADVTATVNSIIMSIIELSGAEQGAPSYDTNDPGVSYVNEMQVATTLDNTWLIANIWNRGAKMVTPTSGQTIVEEVAFPDNGQALSYHNISPPDATADSNWEYVIINSNFQVCITVPPAIIPNRNSAILSATF